MDINIEAEQNNLARMLRAADVEDVWFGLQTNINADGSFSQTWSDESSLSYEAWDPNGNNPSGTSCVVMTELYNYRWGDSVDCNKLLGFVCEFESKFRIKTS